MKIILFMLIIMFVDIEGLIFAWRMKAIKNY